MPLDMNVIATAIIGAVTGVVGLFAGRGTARAQAAKAVAEAEAATAATAATAAEAWRALFESVRGELEQTKKQLDVVRARVDELERHRGHAELLRSFIARAHRYYHAGGTVPYPVPDEVARLVWPERYVEALSTGPIAVGEHIDDRQETDR